VAKLTAAPASLTTTWTKIADLGETFMFSVLGGKIFYAWSASAPAAGSIGHPFFEGDTFGDNATTENAWVRAEVTATIVVSKE
jgi:hypothetical protein